MGKAVRDHLPATASFTIDLPGEYHFPLHIVPTDVHPDIVWGMTLSGPPPLSNSLSHSRLDFRLLHSGNNCAISTLCKQQSARGSNPKPSPWKLLQRPTQQPGIQEAQSCTGPHPQLFKIEVDLACTAIISSHKVWRLRSTDFG